MADFNPEDFMAPATSPEAWTQMQVASIHKAGDAFAEGQQRREQRRQFDTEQARLVDNEMANRAQFQQQFGLQQEQQDLNEQEFAFKQAEFAAKQRQLEQARIQDGMKIIRDAAINAETVDEANAIAESAAKEYNLGIRPMSGGGQRQSGGPLPPHSEVAPVDFKQSNAQREKREEAMVGDLPKGREVTREGKEASRQITEGVTNAAGEVGLPLTATVTDEVPDFDTAAKELSEMRPVAGLEMDSRQRTEADMGASYQKRVDQLQQFQQQFGLTPQQMAMAANIAAEVHGIPPAPMPPPPVDHNDPNAPPGAAADEVTLPQQVAEAMMAPPELRPDLVRDTVQAGGFEVYDKTTGQSLGAFDWGSIQEGKREKRRRSVEPLMGLATDPIEQKRLRAALDSYIEDGNPHAFKILEMFTRAHAQTQSASLSAMSQERLGRKEMLEIQKEKNRQKDVIIDGFEKAYQIKSMREKMRTADAALTRLSAMPEGERNVIGERTALAELLKTAVGSRSSNSDVELVLGKGWDVKAEGFINQITSGGALPDIQLKEISALLRGLKAAEERYQEKAKKALRETVLNDEMFQRYSFYNIDAIAGEVVNRVFPGTGAVTHNTSDTLLPPSIDRTRSTSVRASGTTAEDIDSLLSDDEE